MKNSGIRLLLAMPYLSKPEQGSALGPGLLQKEPQLSSNWKGAQVVFSPAFCPSRVSTKLRPGYSGLYSVRSQKLPRKEMVQSLWAACSSTRLSLQWSCFSLPVWTSLTSVDVIFSHPPVTWWCKEPGSFATLFYRPSHHSTQTLEKEN